MSSIPPTAEAHAALSQARQVYLDAIQDYRQMLDFAMKADPHDPAPRQDAADAGDQVQRNLERMLLHAITYARARDLEPFAAMLSAAMDREADARLVKAARGLVDILLD